jgi:hypothetical protein
MKCAATLCQHGDYEIYYLINDGCHNLNLGLVTKAKACESASQKWSPGVTFHVPESVKECDKMNLHTPKWALTLGIRFLMDSQIIKEQL